MSAVSPPGKGGAQGISVSPLGLLERWLGFLIWRSADPASLPPPPLPGAAVTAAAGGAPGRLAVLLPGILAVLLLAAAAAATFTIRGQVRQAMLAAHLQPGASIDGLADRIERDFAGSPWTLPYPGVRSRWREAAARMREGREELVRLADAYEALRERVNAVPLPARLLQARPHRQELASELDGVRRPWHRGSLTYQEVEAALRPYSQGTASPPRQLKGLLGSAPQGLGLVLEVTGPDGTVLGASALLEPGKSFTLPLERGSRIGFVVIRLEDRAVIETASIGIESWTGEFVPTDARGRFTARFDTGLVEMAPPLPPLSDNARRELAPGGGA